MCQDIQPDIDNPSCLQAARRSQHAASADIRLVNACQVKGCPLPCLALCFLFPVNLYPPDTALLSCRIYSQLLAFLYASLQHGPRRHRAKSLHGKYPVYRQAGRSRRSFCFP